MAYDTDWNITLVGRGKLIPADDTDSIMKMLQAFITALISNGHDVDIKATHIHFDDIEQS